jgi:hypothetical protein
MGHDPRDLVSAPLNHLCRHHARGFGGAQLDSFQESRVKRLIENAYLGCYFYLATGRSLRAYPVNAYTPSILCCEGLCWRRNHYMEWVYALTG